MHRGLGRHLGREAESETRSSASRAWGSLAPIEAPDTYADVPRRVLEARSGRSHRSRIPAPGLAESQVLVLGSLSGHEIGTCPQPRAQNSDDGAVPRRPPGAPSRVKQLASGAKSGDLDHSP
jgi:hypothetical protein